MAIVWPFIHQGGGVGLTVSPPPDPRPRLWFVATIPPLVALRWYLYFLDKHHFFLYDFCYFVQVPAPAAAPPCAPLGRVGEWPPQRPGRLTCIPGFESARRLSTFTTPCIFFVALSPFQRWLFPP